MESSLRCKDAMSNDMKNDVESIPNCVVCFFFAEEDMLEDILPLKYGTLPEEREG